jgi:hypothetical protein
MVKLSEIDIGTKDLLELILGFAGGYYARKPIEEKRQIEKQKDAELFGKTAAQYIVSEIRKLGVEPEAYKVVDELTSTLKELKEELKKYRVKESG